MRTRTRIVNSKIIKTPAGEFHRGLETPTHIYFINFDERKKTVSIKIFNRNREIVDESNVAYNTFKKCIKNKHYTWMSENLQKHLDKSK